MIVGPEFFNYTNSVETAFEKHGFQTRVVDYKPEVSSFKEKVEYRLSANKEEFRTKTLPARFNKRLLKVYNEFKPDLFFIFQELPVHSSLLEQMGTCKKVLWLMDSIFRKEMAYRIRNDVDGVFLFEATDIPKLESAISAKTKFLTCALDERHYFPVDMKEQIDVLFIGHIYPNRFRTLKTIADKFEDRVLKFYGKIDKAVRDANLDYLTEKKNVFLDVNTDPVETNELYASSKVCFNIHAEQSKYGANQRFFEISGAKAYQVVDRNDYIEEHFGNDCVGMYSSNEELCQVIEDSLSDENMRERKAENAHSKVRAGHTFYHRIGEVISATLN